MSVGIKDITGRRFGRLIAAWPAGRAKTWRTYWLCFCDCGNFLSVALGCLYSGNTQSCGCLTKELRRVQPNHMKHGHSRSRTSTPEYSVYKAAKKRCTNKNSANYAYYGGRGIQFRFASFEEFYRELGPRPHGHSIDRIDVNGHYEPGNVRWATHREQMQNRRRVQ